MIGFASVDSMNGEKTMVTHEVEYTDTFCGEANYAWCRRATVTMPELTHYGYDGGTNYAKAYKAYQRELMRRAKAAVGLTGVRGRSRGRLGDMIEFRPYGRNTVLFVTYLDE
jgi:hypothetical protein